MLPCIICVPSCCACQRQHSPHPFYSGPPNAWLCHWLLALRSFNGCCDTLAPTGPFTSDQLGVVHVDGQDIDEDFIASNIELLQNIGIRDRDQDAPLKLLVRQQYERGQAFTLSTSFRLVSIPYGSKRP